MIHFIVSNEATNQPDDEILALLEKSGAAAAIRAVADQIRDKEITKIIVGNNFINIVVK